MEKTANFELSQWDKSDRIMMEDFNADNLKIDQAIHDAWMWTCLGEAAPSEDGLTMTFTVERPADYQEITVYFTSVGTKLMTAAMNGVGMQIEVVGNTTATAASVKAIGKLELMRGLESGMVCVFHVVLQGTNSPFDRSECGMVRDLDLSAPLEITFTAAEALSAGSGLQVFALRHA